MGKINGIKTLETDCLLRSRGFQDMKLAAGNQEASTFQSSLMAVTRCWQKFRHMK